MTDVIEVNDYNTKVTSELISGLKKEVADTLLEYLSSVPYLKTFISKNRKRACDLPRDEKGKIIINIEEPHILEDMDYFRPSALHFEKTGRYTDYRPSKNPNSPFYKWISEERRRCYEGYVRESDGEWITGDYYFFLNYCPMLMDEEDKNLGIFVRQKRFPDVMDGQYYLFHYMWKARTNNLMSCCLASRQKGKTATSAAMLARRLILGESDSARNNVSSTVIASSEDYLTGDDVIFDKFQIYLDHVAETTQWPSKRLKTTEGGLVWQMGYKLNDGKNTRKGSLNKVTGTSINTKKSKKRGGRVSLFIIEEMGSFANLKSLYTTLLPSVRSAKGSYGLIHMIGTSGDSDSDFEGARELFCNPIGHFILNNVNVWDMPLQGTKYIAFFYPAYINLGGYTDKNGNSDVVGALVHLLKERYTVKYNTGDPDALLRHCAENPIFPEESMLRTTRNVFPTLELNERIKQLENDDTAFDEVEVGELFMNGNGDVEFKHTKELPIRFFPHSDNKIRGAVEIFERPIKDKETGEITPGRYIIGNDPVDKDSAETVSLSSTFVFDLYKDCIVAEYTGRRDYAEEGYEITRMLCRYYNAQCYFENNLLGFFNYMKEKGDLKYVAKTPSTIKAQELSANDGVRNTTYGIRSTTFTINRFLQQIRDWLLQEVPAQDENGNAIMTKNLYLIKNLALLKELALYNDKGNFDRISALGMLMLGREEKITITGGNFGSVEKHDNYKEDKFISQCLNGGRKRFKSNFNGVERYSREEVKRILNIDSNLKLYHFK